jgi:LPPG:FO 2-phospho-L-lactate transferase
MLVILSGGTGTPKLIQGFSRLLKPNDFSVIANTGEDTIVSGLHVSPDIDTVVYTLAGIVDEDKWYGIRGDTFFCHEMLKQLGQAELLRIGDRDRAIILYRTTMLKQGKSLSEVTKEICDKLGVRTSVLPMTNDKVQTRIHTEAGPLTFHEFLIARGASDKVLGVSFEGTEEAKPAPGVIEALQAAKLILIGPSNPVTSIGPILAIKEIREFLSQNRDKVLAVSPIIGRRPVSGPAGALMQGIGQEVTPLGVAQMYRSIAASILIDEKDEQFGQSIMELGMRVMFADLLMPDHAARVRLARTILQLPLADIKLPAV